MELQSDKSLPLNFSAGKLLIIFKDFTIVFVHSQFLSEIIMMLKVLSNENRGGSKLVSMKIHFYITV